MAVKIQLMVCWIVMPCSDVVPTDHSTSWYHNPEDHNYNLTLMQDLRFPW